MIEETYNLSKEEALRLLWYKPFKKALLRQAKDAGFSEEEIVELLSK